MSRLTFLGAALRRLLRRPGFALAVLLTLTLGVGANTATFDLLYGYLLAPLPYPEAERLATLSFSSARIPGDLGMSYTTYLDLRRQTPAIAETGMVKAGSVNLVAGRQSTHIASAEISASLLTTLSVAPIAGSLFGPAANQPGAPHQLLISDRLWRRLFNRDPAIIGKTVRLSGSGLADTPYQVTGVMPARFQYPSPDTDLWLAYILTPMEADAHNITAWGGTMLVRLKPNQTLIQLSAQAQTVLDREIAHFPDASAIPLFQKYNLRITARPLRSQLLGDLRTHLLMAQLATGLLLLLIWVNLANLFIARALQQRGELVLRRVLGAETSVLFRSLLTESLTLCLAGGIAGFLMGRLAVQALLGAGLLSTALPPARDVFLVAGIALLLAILSALVFALAGLYFIRRQDLAQALKDMDARSAGGRGERRVRAALVIIQLTLACVLTALGAMLSHGLLKLSAQELGFRPEALVTFRIDTPTQADPPGPDVQRQLAQMRQALATVPGVASLTLASSLPFDGENRGNTVFQFPFDGGHTPTVIPIITDAAYFQTLDIPLHQGRAPGAGEMVIDTQVARELFGKTDVLGRELNFNSPNDARPNMRFRISGIVGETRRSYTEQTGGSVYVNAEAVLKTTGSDAGWSWASDAWYVAVRTRLAPAVLLPALKEALERSHPGTPMYDVRTMDGRLAQQLAAPRGLATLVLLFAVSALAVAAVGLYAVASYTVGQRRPELGIRAALGADQIRLRRLVLSEIGQQLLIGIPIGLIGAVVLGKLFSEALYGVPPTDPISLAFVTGILTAVTLLAGWVPAWRAGRVSPVEALRDR